MHNQEAREEAHPSQEVSTVHGRSSRDKEGNQVYKQHRVCMIPDSTRSATMRYRSGCVGSQESSRRSSPPPTTNYVGSEISFPSQTPREAAPPTAVTSYRGSVVAMPPSAHPEDPVTEPRVSAGIIARRYIQSEENSSQHPKEISAEEEMELTQSIGTPISR